MAADSASALPAAVVDAARAFDSALAQVGGDTEGGQGGGGGFLEAARRSPRTSPACATGAASAAPSCMPRHFDDVKDVLSLFEDDTHRRGELSLPPQRYNHE